MANEVLALLQWGTSAIIICVFLSSTATTPAFPFCRSPCRLHCHPSPPIQGSSSLGNISMLARRGATTIHAGAVSTSPTSTPLIVATRCVYTGVFDHPPFSYRRQHTFNTLPMHDANRFGGRTAYLREIGPIDHKKKGRLFKRDLPTLQFNVDVWCAQQTLRKQWKGRDWDVVEMPFEMAPKELQRVVPEKYTDVPMMTDPACHDYMNIRRKVFDREDMQDALFASGGAGQSPYPAIQRVDKAAMTLDKYL